MAPDLLADLNDALGLVIQRFGADAGTIHLMGDDGALHLAAATKGIPAAVLDVVRVVPVGKGMAGLAAERREPVAACNLQTDSSGDVRPGARATGMQGAIAVPMMAGGRVVGVLGVANRAERTFTAEEIASLLEAGSTLAERITL